MRKALYFPYISIPEGKWLTRSLLYWDKLGCIVPSSFTHEPERFERYMLDYIHEGLIEQVVPSYYIYDIPNFEDCFFEYLENAPHFLKIKREVLKGIPQRYTLIHLQKLGQVGNKLEKMNLAVKRDNEWYLIQSTVASYFMTYLASLLGAIEDFSPVTRNDIFNIPNYFCNKKFSFASIDKYDKQKIEKIKVINPKNASDRDNYREIIFDKIFPVPTKSISAYEIQKFKDTHYDSLESFRIYIEKELFKIKNMSQEDHKEYLDIFIDEATSKRRQLEDKMNSFGWLNISKSTIGAILLNGYGLYGGLETSNTNSAINSGGNLLLSIMNALGNKQDLKRDLNRDPLAYVVHSKRRFG